ncbi:hypothetical protein C0991_002327 [Blastosporella zonata]|nr:hypothetical protein C0991_002327 [Blastosporella zonata]
MPTIRPHPSQMQERRKMRQAQCVSCGPLSSHTSYARDCLTLAWKSDELDSKLPENTMPYFPTIDSADTWLMAPPTQRKHAPDRQVRIQVIEKALNKPQTRIPIFGPPTRDLPDIEPLTPTHTFTPEQATQIRRTQQPNAPNAATRQTNLLQFITNTRPSPPNISPTARSHSLSLSNIQT